MSTPRKLTPLSLAITLITGVLMAVSAPLAAPAEASAPFSGPITITKGGTYSGSWESLNADIPAVTIRTSEPVIIENSAVRGRGHLFRGATSHIKLTIRNTRGMGLNPNLSGRSPGRFLHLELFDSLAVERNTFESTSGIYLLDYRGNQTAKHSIRITGNRVTNIDGRRSNGAGGWQASSTFAQFLQMNKVQNVPAVDVSWNEVINEFGKSAVEDVISLYRSGGTSTSPMAIQNNFIWGAFPLTTGDGYTGGGIMLGDEAFGDHSQGWVVARNNQVVGTTNHGISVICGHNQLISGNRVISSGTTSAGVRLAAANAGLIVSSASRWGGGCPSGSFVNNRVSDNTVGWHRYDGKRNDWWTPECTTSTCTGNARVSGTITYEAERAEKSRWDAKVMENRIVLGAASATTPAPTTTAPVTTTTTSPPVPEAGITSDTTVLLVMANAAAPTTGDTVVSNHLRTGLGYQVKAISDEATPNLSGIDAVVIVESVNSTTLGTKYRDTPIPVLVAENGAWQNMRMATGNNTHAGQTQLKVTAAAHPAAGGLNATNHTVANATIDLKHPTSIPATATKVATSAADTTRPILWTIDRNAAMTTGTAPARRVGLGLNDTSYANLNHTGFDLFDAAIHWMLNDTKTTEDKAMLLFGDGATHLNRSEIALRSRLRSKGLDVTIVRDTNLTSSAEANAYDLVVISKTVLSTAIGNKLKATTTPVIFWEDNQQQSSMLATINNTNVNGTGWHSAGTQLTLHTASDATLRAGLSGTTNFLTTTGEITYAPKTSNGAQTLGTGATRIADHSPGLTAIYTYDTGTKLADNTPAAGRRAYFGLYDDTYRLLTTQGVALFDALLDWSLASATTPAPTTTAPVTTTTTSPPVPEAGITSDTTVLLVMANAAAPTTGDTVVSNHLRTGLGYQVKAISDEATPNLSGIDAVVIVESVNSTTLGTKYRDTPIPVLVAENGAWQNMRMATGNNTHAGQTQLKVTAAAHPAAGGLNAINHTVANATIDLKHPTSIPATATKVATSAADTTRPILWTIDRNAAMTTGTAPARRVGLGLNDTSYANLNHTGFDLFDAAIHWMLL